MESIRDRILKLAAAKKPMTNKAKIEQDLIHKIKHGNDYEAEFAEIQLIKKYRNVIGQQATKSGLSSVIDPNLAHSYGVKILKDSIRKYDPTKDIQPNTYFQRTLFDRMGKEKQWHVNFAAQKTEDLTQKNAHIMRAEGLLRMQLGREPTDIEIYNYIKDELKKVVQLKDIVRNKLYNRNEYSGNTQIGSDVGAEFMTKMDLLNVDPITPQQAYLDKLNKEEWLGLIKTFKKKNERRFLYNYLGLGEFEGRPAKSLSSAATNSNMNNYEAKKVAQKFYDMATHKPNLTGG
jgi:DNA-directed RNA polymerase specialized sigma subunit